LDNPHARWWKAILVGLASVFAAGLVLGMAVLPRVGLSAAPSAAASTESDTMVATGPLAERIPIRSAAPTATAVATSAPASVMPTTAPTQVARPASSTIYVVPNLAFTQPVDCGGSSCQVLLDVYVPAGSGPFPIAVLVRGGPSGFGGRAYLDPFASELARAGILVFNADYRDVASQGGGYPNAFEDVACAIRFARAEAGEYRGDSGPVTLVGHSLGGWVGSVVALDPTEFEGGCLASGSGRPNAFVGLAGNYQIDSGENASDLSTFFGGSAADTAAARASSNPFNYATGTSVPVWLVAGTADETVDPAASVALNAFLKGRGWDVTLQLVPGASHGTIIGSDDSQSVQAVIDAVAAARHNG
jgi:acetyl esterase/lipase